MRGLPDELGLGPAGQRRAGGLQQGTERIGVAFTEKAEGGPKTDQIVD
jgi:hypothetical protein